jgi:hypothetical protein
VLRNDPFIILVAQNYSISDCLNVYFIYTNGNPAQDWTKIARLRSMTHGGPSLSKMDPCVRPQKLKVILRKLVLIIFYV